MHYSNKGIDQYIVIPGHPVSLPIVERLLEVFSPRPRSRHHHPISGTRGIPVALGLSVLVIGASVFEFLVSQGRDDGTTYEV